MATVICKRESLIDVKGVTAFIKEDENEDFRLIFNDVESTSSVENPEWRHSVIFTENTYNRSNMKSLTLKKNNFKKL